MDVEPGGEPVPVRSHPYGIIASGDINIVERDDQQGIIFEGGTGFLPMQKIKTDVRNSREMELMHDERP